MIDGELGSFLRRRREAVTPAEVGLPTGPRRRTPGLRRAELATLAGVSVEYLTRLEQGRDTHPSAAVLAALADALRLSDDDRDHLRQLAYVSGGTELCPAAVPLARSVRPSVQAILDQLEPAPALVVNRLEDLLAWTRGFDLLARPLGLLDGEVPNLLQFTFTDDRSRAAYPDWDRIADEQVASLRSEVRGPDDDARQLADRLALTAGSEFTDRWDRQVLGRSRTGVRVLVHPTAGLLRLAYETLALPDVDEQRLIVYLAADAATSASLDRLSGRHPGGLHALNAV
jgi:transcriptional regulator with XRE-family HTH domain